MLPQFTESPPLCACGCGLPVKRASKAPHGWNRRIHNHMGHPFPGVNHASVAPLCACGCGQPVQRHTQCHRWNRYLPKHGRRRPVADRFWEKVNKNGPTPEHRPELGPCWVWTANNRNGYGRFLLKGKFCTASRVSWTLHFGEIPEGQNVCHKCDNPPCVRPDHLFLGDQLVNMRDVTEKQRRPSRRGEGNAHAKLTRAQAQAIRDRRLAGEATLDLAAEFGIARGTVYRIASGELWKD